MASWVAIFDFDGTLTQLEGLDELARMKYATGELTDEEQYSVAECTRSAMDGTTSIADALEQRLGLLRPTQRDCTLLAERYASHLVDGAVELFDALRQQGWHLRILSGGLRPAIEPVATGHFGVAPQDLFALPVFFDGNGEAFRGFDRDFPGGLTGGKAMIVQRWKEEMAPDTVVVVIGDGATDAEAGSVVDAFIAFTGVVARPGVIAATKYVASTLPHVKETLTALKNAKTKPNRLPDG